MSGSNPTAIPTSDERSVGIVFPSGMLGAGFSAESIKRGVAMGATAIAIDGGSTDSGPHYLGTGTAKSDASAIERDLRILLVACHDAGIPLLVGSCATAGTDAGVEWVADIATRIAADEGLSFRLARIYSEIAPRVVVDAIGRGRVRGLPPHGDLDAETVLACRHIVALMGQQPMAEALDAGADVILAGRSTDTAMVAAVARRAGLPPGPAWHAAKTVECGGQCTTNPRSGGVFVRIDRTGFTVEPLSADSACTPLTVAAHMLYENADPFRLHEPDGTLDTTHATYDALDERTVRVEGSRFDPAPCPTAKLEGCRLAGFETISFVGIRDPKILGQFDTWTELLRTVVEDRMRVALDLEPADYRVAFQFYGSDGVLGALEQETAPPREVGLLFKVRARDQATATAIAKTANPYLLHLPLPDMPYLPSFAFATSPAEIERGAAYEFVLNHVIEMVAGAELFRTAIDEVGRG